MGSSAMGSQCRSAAPASKGGFRKFAAAAKFWAFDLKPDIDMPGSWQEPISEHVVIPQPLRAPPAGGTPQADRLR
jgi:hypothetical protein